MPKPMEGVNSAEKAKMRWARIKLKELRTIQAAKKVRKERAKEEAKRAIESFLSDAGNDGIESDAKDVNVAGDSDEEFWTTLNTDPSHYAINRPQPWQRECKTRTSRRELLGFNM